TTSWQKRSIRPRLSGSILKSSSRRRPYVRAIPIFIVLAACLGAADNRDQSRTGMDAARLAQVPVRMKAFVDKGTIAGCVTLVMRHGAVASLEATGYTDIETRQPIRTDAIFQIHSMTKPIVGAGIMMLMEEGKLALSDPVEKHLPEFRGLWVV